jgi:pyruvate/2-oxoglutarate dehydrogenase complex dihydrolipoamide acyltransferase (E2) component
MGGQGGVLQVVCPVTGVVQSVERGAGARVGEEEPLVTVEVDGTRVVVRAGVDGILREVQAEVGAEVEPGDVLAFVEPYDQTVLTDAVPDSDAPADPPRRKERRCTQCGSTELEPGFLTDRGQGSFSQWVAGRLETGILGGPRLLGRRRLDIMAARCVLCDHLELYATGPRE